MPDIETPDRPTPGPWGIEMTPTHIWVGPMRKDRSGKISAIVCDMDIENVTPEAAAQHLANAKHIVHCVNTFNDNAY